ncbi:MAG: TIGR03016 family PEP-CTERM system-associated outer membrane protein [Candidatus Thiodiazotropha sp.]
MIIKKLNHLNKDQSNGGKASALFYLVCGMGLSSVTSTIFAADWVISPSVGLQHIYTDNALLTNEDPATDNITVLRPTLSLLKEGGRATLDFNYAPEYRHYWDETHDNEAVHFLRGDGNIELAENHLFLDGWVRADRTNITSSGRSSTRGLTGAVDDTDYYTVGLSPYFTAKLGDFSVVEARLIGDKVKYSEDIDNDSTGKRAELAFGNGSMFTSQIWEVLFQQSNVDYENQDDDNEIRIFRAELIQQLTAQWALAFSAGYEEYELVLSEDRDDSTWSLGAIYTPTSRTRIAVGGGERSFGDDYYFDFSHRTGKTVWTATYEQDFISARDELGAQPLFERLDAFGNLVRDPILESTTVLVRSGYSPTLNEDYYETERFSAQFVYQTLRSSLTLRASHLERNYDRSESDTKDTSLALIMSRRLTRMTTGYIHLTGNDHEENNLVYDQWSAMLGAAYQFSADSRIDFNINRLERDAEREADSYTENSASITFRTQL